MVFVSSKGYSDSFERAQLVKLYSNMDENKLSLSSVFSFDIWEIIIELLKGFNKERKIRIIDIGGGTGRVSSEGFKYGFEVYLTDLLLGLLRKAEEKCEKFRGRTCVLDIFDNNNVLSVIDRWGYFDVVLCLGFVINHTDNLGCIEKGFYNMVKLMNDRSLMVIDVMISELYSGNPTKLWDNVTNTLVPMSFMLKLIRKYGLLIEHFHSIKYSYPEYKGYKYTDRGVRFYLIKLW